MRQVARNAGVGLSTVQRWVARAAQQPLDDVEWAAALGFYNKWLHVSLRTINRDINAGDLLQKVLGSKSAGGHDMIAGGRVRVEEGGIAPQKAAVRIKERLLKALGVDGCKARSLVG